MLTVTQLACVDSVDTVTITAAASPGNKAYLVDDVAGTVTFLAMTQTSLYCAATDIVNTFTWTSASGLPTAFITQSGFVFSWSTSDNTQTGTYTITLTSVITRQTGYSVSQTQSISLTVSARTCALSLDTSTIVANPSST